MKRRELARAYACGLDDVEEKSLVGMGLADADSQISLRKEQSR